MTKQKAKVTIYYNGFKGHLIIILIENRINFISYKNAVKWNLVLEYHDNFMYSFIWGNTHRRVKHIVKKLQALWN